MVNLKCFDRIIVGPAEVKGRRASVKYTLEFDGLRKEYELVNVYPEDVDQKVLSAFFNVAGIVPAINYTLFSDEIKLDLELD